MRFFQPARRLSSLTIDSDLDMAGYHILLGAALLKTTNLALKELNSTTMAVRDGPDTA